MELSDRIAAFSSLGKRLHSLSTEEIKELSAKAQTQNGWFTERNVSNALEGLAYMLDEQKLTEWANRYAIGEAIPKIVGIVMAGNIPMVGFHDLLCVLISGHYAAIKPSSDDGILTQAIIDWLLEIEPRFKKNLELREKLTNIDAVIATGSDNTSRYFEYYFKDIPHIIRKNRTSVAILTGDESAEDLQQLGVDIFSYFGLGCRNVSKIFTPKGYDLTKVFPHWEPYTDLVHHHKYRNNYDYYKSIYLVNKTPHLDTGFLLTVSTDEMVSPISVLYHQEYEDLSQLEQVLDTYEDKIQCKVGSNRPLIPFGKAQRPELWDYADNIDVVQFLTQL